jgi:uncharacterized damage-inducible protein DinB
MTKDTFTLLAQYNRRVNERVNPCITTLGDEEWNREFGGYFSSIHSLCSHIYVCDFIWLKRFGALREFKTLKDELFDRNLSFKETLFPTKDEYLVKRQEMDRTLIDFTGEITDADLPKTLKYSSSDGTPLEKPFQLTLLHVFNHETHHRGMISLYLELLGKENDFSSVIASLG